MCAWRQGASPPNPCLPAPCLPSPSLSPALSDRQAGPVAAWQACPGSCSHKVRPSELRFGELIRPHSSSRAPGAGLHTAPFRAAEGSWLRSLAGRGEAHTLLSPERGWEGPGEPEAVAGKGTMTSQPPKASSCPGSALLSHLCWCPSLKLKFLA